MISTTIGRYIDRREVYAALKPPSHLATGSEIWVEPVWVDFVADVGDGHRATSAVAGQLIRPLPDVAGSLTRPGSALLLGGDLVYPTPSREDYQRRFQEPYAPVFEGEAARRRRVFAIPGNHDWYDGLGLFYSLFCAPDRIGDSAVEQTCSYWSVDLHPYWQAWGIDIALTGSIDPPQSAYFARVARGFDERGGRGLIVCVGEPFWEEAPDDELAAAVRRLLPASAEVVLFLSGDRHYLAAWGPSGTRRPGGPVPAGSNGDACAPPAPDAVPDVGAVGGPGEPAVLCVTAGGGGAFLSSTLGVRERVVAPRPGDDATGAPGPGDAAGLNRLLLWPSERCWGRRLRPGVVLKLLRTYSLVALLGLIVVALGYIVRLATTEGVTFGTVAGCDPAEPLAPAGIGTVIGCVGGDGFWRAVHILGWTALRTTACWGALLGLFAGLYALARHGRATRIGAVILGLAHTAAHGAVVIGASALAMLIAADVPTAAVRAVVYVSVLWLAGGVASVLVLGLYLLAASVVRVNLNELASAMWNEDWKNFVRLRLASDGIEVHLFGVRDTSRPDLAAEPLARVTLSLRREDGGRVTRDGTVAAAPGTGPPTGRGPAAP